MTHDDDTTSGTYLNSFYSSILEDVKLRKKYLKFWDKDSDFIGIENVDFCISENAEIHRTHLYEQTSTPPFRAILRRGQPFKIRMNCSRALKPQTDIIVLEFRFGSSPKTKNNTLKRIRVGNNISGCNWGAWIEEVHGDKLTIEVQASCSAHVGEWRVQVLTGIETATDISTALAYEHDEFIYFIFNPWLKDDSVYLEDEEERKEYVLNETGAVWRGAGSRQFEACPWNFGQFEDVALYSALFCLRISELSDDDRGNPVLITRCLTHLITDHILHGKWSDPYDDGTKPWQWVGSVEILEQFISNGLKPVKYGQCWVFSGLLNSLLRALGIPARSVTNLSSAHDTDKTLTVDEQYIKDPRTHKFKLAGKTDSIWNFHVWNEAWMRRDDLPPGFDGWQACDATPQEYSAGKLQCGPMSVKAIKDGNIKLNYDGWFVYGEVNADIAQSYYEFSPRAPDQRKLINIQLEKDAVGTALITSSLTDPYKAINILDTYKPREGSTEERDLMRAAIRTVVAADRSDILKLYNIDPEDKDETQDIKFHFVDLKEIKYGDPIDTYMTVENVCNEKRTLMVQLELWISRYTGEKHNQILSKQSEIVFEPKEKRKLPFKADAQSYHCMLGEHDTLALEGIGQISETGKVHRHRDTFLIRKPQLYIEVEKHLVVDRPATAIITYEHTSNVVLTNCTLRVEGCGLNRSQELNIDDELPGRGSIRIAHNFVPMRPGKRRILAVFCSRELANIRGSTEVIVSRTGA